MITHRSSAVLRKWLSLGCLLLGLIVTMHAQDRPYFVSYSDDLEEPGEVDIETKTALAGGKYPFAGMASEVEVGVRKWWTTGFYLDGQVTDEDSAIYTGFRLENRLKPFTSDHAINPVLYFEYENISAADKTILEIVGHDGEADLDTSNAVGQRDHLHEGELKLILSSDAGSWNFSENFIAEKNLGHAPWEFGYSIGITRPLGAASGRSCSACAEKVVAGVELYGGAGDTHSLTLKDTAHYLAPIVGWNFSSRARISASTGFGLTDTSVKAVYRIGFVYEFDHLFGRTD